jgi:Rod binding domain-containing protein
MQVSPLERGVKASDLPVERLATNPALSEREKVQQLSREFESLLLRQILADAGKNVIHSDLMPKSVSADIYKDMVVSQLADRISQSGAFGLARTLEKELTRQLAPDGAKRETH